MDGLKQLFYVGSLSYLYNDWLEFTRLMFSNSVAAEDQNKEAEKFGLPNVNQMERLYPEAAAIMEALSVAVNYPYNDIGNITLKKILDGDDYKKALCNMNKYIDKNLSGVDLDKYSVDMKKVVAAYLERDLEADVCW